MLKTNRTCTCCEASKIVIVHGLDLCPACDLKAVYSFEQVYADLKTLSAEIHVLAQTERIIEDFGR